MLCCHATVHIFVKLMNRTLSLLGLVSVGIGLVSGAMLMWIAWQENSQCEIHCAELGIDWSHWLVLGGAGLIFGFVGSMLLGAVLILVLRLLNRA